MKRLMTAEEFVRYWCEPDEHGRSLLSHIEENLGEREAEYRNECAMFGDAGPGQWRNLLDMKRDHAKVVARLDQLSEAARQGE